MFLAPSLLFSFTIAGGESVASTPIPSRVSPSLVTKSFFPDGPATNDGKMSSSFELLYSLSISLEEGTGSSQLAVIGSAVGLLLLLVAIVGVVLLML